MKKLLFAIAFMTAGSVAVLAQDSQDSTSIAPQTPPSTEIQAPPSSDDQGQVQDQDKGQPIATSELPASIQASLQGQDYSGWMVANAFKKDKDGKTFYSVELAKGDEKKMVNFDADGNVIKEDEKQK